MSRKQLSDLDFGGVARIRNLPAPVNPDEPVRQQDLNSAVEGLAWKDSCRVASQANVNLSSPGASIDGITLTVGDRILVKAQTVGSENGLYIWNGAAVSMFTVPTGFQGDSPSPTPSWNFRSSSSSAQIPPWMQRPRCSIN